LWATAVASASAETTIPASFDVARAEELLPLVTIEHMRL
jgi:hypothetical protein